MTTDSERALFLAIQADDAGQVRSLVQADPALLDEGRDTEAAQSVRADREIALLGFFEFSRLPVAHDCTRQFYRMHDSVSG